MFQPLPHLVLYHFNHLVIAEVYLVYNNNNSLNPEKLKHPEMVLCLKHPSVVKGNNKQRKVNSPGAGNHVPDKPFMPRNINNADCAETRIVHTGKSDIDGHLPLFLFRKPVAVDSGKSPYERGFTMIYMTRCSDYIHLIYPFIISLHIIIQPPYFQPPHPRRGQSNNPCRLRGCGGRKFTLFLILLFINISAASAIYSISRSNTV